MWLLCEGAFIYTCAHTFQGSYCNYFLLGEGGGFNKYRSPYNEGLANSYIGNGRLNVAAEFASTIM